MFYIVANKKYVVGKNESEQKARLLMREYERDDKSDGTYIPGWYSVVD